jgi:hypothetical protein
MNLELANHVMDTESRIQQDLLNNEHVEAVVHTDECLNNDSRKKLVISLRNRDNTISVRLNKPHLMIISYNRTRFDMTTLLQHIQNMGHRAQLVGGV